MLRAFGDCVIDPSCFDLRRRGKVVKLEPKVFDVLLHLIEHLDRVVTKQELLDELWPGEAVSDSVLPRCIAAMRRAVGDTRARQRVIATVHGRGYRFVASLKEVEAAASDLGSESTKSSLSVPGSEAPRHVAVPPDSDFVGREAAMKRLAAGLERAEAGQGGISLVVGEPGIGKTRIADEISVIAAEAGFEVLIGRCYEGEGAPAYWPWVQILRDAAVGTEDNEMLRSLVGGGAADLAQLLPDLDVRLGSPKGVSGPDGEQARFRLYDAATRFLVARTGGAPLLLILDDLHWADASSLGLLRFLVGQTTKARMLVIATYRDVDVRRGHPLADLLGALARTSHCDRVALSGFDESEITSFVSHLMGESPGANFVTTMREMTEGNPFFLREIVRLIADQGDAAALDSERLHVLRLPQGIRDAIGRRLDALSPECNEMLRGASVIGRSFRIGQLAPLLDLPDSQGLEGLLELLAEALDAGLIVETARGSFCFAHALTRQTLYEELRVPQRIALHRRAGEALERSLEASSRTSDENLAELAHHFFEAAPGGDVHKAIAYAVCGAEASHRKRAYDEAVGFYERALEALTLRVPVDDERRAELLLALGEAQFTAGARDRALASLGHCVELARQLGRPELMARAAIAIRAFGELGSPPGEGVIELLHESLDALPADADRLRSQLVSRLGGAAASSIAEREVLARRALELAERSGDPIALRDAWSAKWWATLGPDRVAERYDVVRAYRGLAQQTNDPRNRLLALECEVGADLVRGDFQATERNLGEYEEVAAELRQPIFIFMGMNYRTSWLINRGRFAEAEARVEEAYAYGKDIVPFAAAVCKGQLFWSRSNRGGETLATGEELEELLRNTLMQKPVERLFLAMLHFSTNRDVSGAYELVKDIDFRSIDRDEHWLLAMTTLADIATEMGDREIMEWLYGALSPYSDLIAIHDLLRAGRGSVASSVGFLAQGLGDLDDAVGFFERAIDLEEAADMRPGLVVSRLRFAHALRRRDAPQDAERAARLLTLASQESEALGLGPGVRGSGFRDLGRTGKSPPDSAA